jgi:hypothetical protein
MGEVGLDRYSSRNGDFVLVLRLLVATLVSVEIGQVVERYHNFVMVAAECFFEGRQPSLDRAARLQRSDPVVVEGPQVVECTRDIAMVAPECFFGDRQHSPVERFSIDVATLAF